ncbi:unnamed protein product [Medioppia subpectinata]|uniref:Calponin-homology (CH) domain-containing protein n=1 Tax=Medioppia subpectinata TaxID=1979941 RepID=A0A7R9KEJ7_9ACAR|nr:unnamed protein product [Medioppia subpectinata]CAG2101939.1 unnamed protein product [Medioppia subpectinata]
MAFQGPSYGLSRECQKKSLLKFDINLALEALDWVRAVTNLALEAPNAQKGFQDQFDFADCLKDGVALCCLINILRPDSVVRINESKAPFKQVNDLYERKNLYMVVNCLFALGGLAQKNRFRGPVIGVKIAEQNRRCFSKEVLNNSQSVIGLQYGTNIGANQSGMTPYGAPRQIIPDYR